MDLRILNDLGIANQIDVKWVVLPAALLAVYTLLFMFYMGLKRKRAAEDGSVDPKYFRLYQGEGLSDELQLLNRHYNNLLEAPILFYLATVIAILTHQVTTLVVTLCWIYFATRMLHSWVHLNGNRVFKRFMVFGLGILTLFILWITLIVGMFI
jgi:hypothetical protein